MKSIKRFFPILEWLPTYRRSQLSGDVYAGVTVGVMLIPQGMAYALIAGLPPVYGLYAAIVPQIIYAILGTSRQLSVGSVAMDSLLVASGIAVFAEEGTDAYLGFAILLAFFVGLFQLLLGFFRMGFITNLLSKPVISGFTSAAAVIIALNQLKYLLGIEIEKSSTIYTLLWEAILHVNETHVVTLAIGTSGILIIRLAKSIHKNIPGALLVVMLGTLLVYLLKLDTHGVSIVRTVPEGLPAFKRPAFDLGMFHEVLPLAFTIAIVSFIEAFSIAKSIEVKKKTHRVRPNQELIALGAANLIGSFFQSYPVTGGFSRSAVNDQIGSHTPLSSMISALLVALTLAFLTPLFYFLPHAVLASVVMVSVAGLLDWNYAKQLWHDNKVEFFLLLVTFLVTISINMVSGITTGILFSILILLYRAAYPHIARLGRLKGHHEFRNITRFKDLETWDDLLILRIDASLTFINIQGVKAYIEGQTVENPTITKVIIDAGPISHLDATAIYGLRDLLTTLNERGVILLLCDIIGPVRDIMHRTGLTQTIGEEHLFLSLGEAVEYATGRDRGSYKEEALQSNYSGK